MESIFEKYVGDVRTLLPLHRILVFVFALLLSAMMQDGGGSQSLLMEMLGLPANREGVGELLANALVADYVLASLAVLAVWLVHRVTSKLLVSSIWCRLKVDQRLSNEYADFDRLRIALELRVVALNYLQKEAKRRAAVSKAWAIVAELSFGLGLCLIAFSFHGTWFDSIIGLSLLPVGLFFQSCSFIYYLRHVMPYELSASALADVGPRLGKSNVK